MSESKTVWFPINTQWRTENANLVEVTYLDLQDVLLQFGDLTEDNRNITTIVPYQTRPYEADDDIQVSIIYERDLDFHRVDREVYSILDWLGDVGGLYEAVQIICGTLLYLLNFMSFENYMVSELFKKENDDYDDKDDKGDKGDKDSKDDKESKDGKKDGKSTNTHTKEKDQDQQDE